MTVEICTEPFDPWQVIGRSGPVTAGKCGATAVFVGTMRDFNEGLTVREMFLEHYPGMTERHLEAIAAEAAGRWELLDTLIVHRVGRIRPDETIVVVGAWAAHRAEAFAGARYLIEELKSRAPFWKKERLPDGERWVAKNTPAG